MLRILINEQLSSIFVPAAFCLRHSFSFMLTIIVRVQCLFFLLFINAHMGYLCPVLLLGVRVHVGKAPQDQGFHQGPLHGAGQQVEGRAAAGELLGQVPPALTLNHDVGPEQKGGQNVRHNNSADNVQPVGSGREKD